MSELTIKREMKTYRANLQSEKRLCEEGKDEARKKERREGEWTWYK